MKPSISKKKNRGLIQHPLIIILLGISGIVLMTIFFTRLLHSEKLSPEQHPLPRTELFSEKYLTGRQVAVLTNPPHLRSAEALGEWFHEETGAVVRNVVVSYGEMLDHTLEDVTSNVPRLDVFMIWYPDLGSLAEKGALADMTDFINENQESIRPEDFIPSLYDAYTLYKNRRWAIPYDGDTHVLFYRKSLFRKYELNPPETWDDYLHAIQTITLQEQHNGIYGTAIMAFPAPVIIISSFMNRLGSYGGSLLDDNGRPTLSSPESVAALSAMVEHARYALPTPLETDFEVSRDAFLSGKVAMVEQWTDIGVMAENPTQSLIRGDWDVVQIPKGSGDKACHAPALNAGYCLGISRKAPNPDVAGAYLLFSTRPDITLRLNLINGGIDPTRISVLTSKAYGKVARGFSGAAETALSSAVALPNLPQTPNLLDELVRQLVMALEHHKTPRQSLEDAQARWLEILGPEAKAAE